MNTIKTLSVNNNTISNAVFNVEVPITAIFKNPETHYDTFYIIFKSEKHCKLFVNYVNDINSKISVADDDVKHTYIDLSVQSVTPIMVICNGRLNATTDISDDALAFDEINW